MARRQIDPILFASWRWSGVNFYDKQREFIRSVRDNYITCVPAGNMLGKDFGAGFVAIEFFLTRQPVRILTMSAKERHLDVLWSEIMSFVDSCDVPLDHKVGGPLVLNHMKLRKMDPFTGRLCRKSYLMGMVASDDTIESLGGHHIPQTGDGIPKTLAIIDEASSLKDSYWEKIITWADRILLIGNTWPCENIFRKIADEGDKKREDGEGYWQKVIRIRATDSPNIRYALAQIENGIKPTGEMIVPGVKGWDRYQMELALWDARQRSVSHDAEWHEGPEDKLFPKEWLDRANGQGEGAEAIQRRNSKEGRAHRRALAVGCDPGEGSANTAFAAGDALGLIELVSIKTPDTSQIKGRLIEFGRKHGVPPENWLLDRGGGGKQIADSCRNEGLNVRTVSFGDKPQLEIRRTMHPTKDRKDVQEQRTAYFNLRAQMYGEFSTLLDPSMNPAGYGIPVEYQELRRQLRPIPKTWDNEGRLKLLPKNATIGSDGKVNENQMTLIKLLGCSPDEADAMVLAVHGLLHPAKRAKAGGIEVTV